MKKFLRHISLLITFSIIFSLVAFAQYQTDFQLSASSVYLVNTDTGEVILDINSDEKINPGNMTKLMTAIVVIENTPKPLEEAEASMTIGIQNYLYNTRISGVSVPLGGFLNGEFTTLDKLLYAILLPGANDAAMMAANYVGDNSEGYFVEMMNKKAQEIGALNTNFENSHGLEGENHYTTAYDMHLIIEYALDNPLIADILTTATYNGGPTNMHDTLHWNNSNRTVISSSPHYSPSIVGGIESKGGNSTGFVEGRGYSYASKATREGYNYILVVMDVPAGDDDNHPAFVETNKIYNWVFSAFKVKTVVDKGETLTEVPLRLASENKDHLKLMSGEMLTALLPESLDVESVTVELDLPSAVNAPVERGDYIGTATYSLAGREIGSVEVVAAETVNASSFETFIDELWGITDTFMFKFVLILVVLLLAVYIFFIFYINKRKRRYRRGR